MLLPRSAFSCLVLTLAGCAEGGGTVKDEATAAPACWLVADRIETYVLGDDGTMPDTWRTATTVRYDEHGNEIETVYEQDSFDDGTVDYTWHTTADYVYDARGNVLSVVHSTNRGETEEWWGYTYTYDDRDNRLSEAADWGLDGTIDQSYAWSYDEHDNVVLEASEGWYRAWAYTYDADGNVLLLEYDSGLDGTVDLRETRTFDAHGNVLTYELVDDTDDDSEDGGWVPGRVDVRAVYTYDAADQRTTAAFDTHGDGTVELTEAWTWDAAGNVRTHDADHATDPTYTRAETWTYDDRQNVLVYTDDHAADGTIDVRNSWTWDDHDQPLTYVQEWQGSPFPTAYTHTYEVDLPATTATDRNADGTVEERRAYTWACTPA